MKFLKVLIALSLVEDALSAAATFTHQTAAIPTVAGGKVTKFKFAARGSIAAVKDFIQINLTLATANKSNCDTTKAKTSVLKWKCAAAAANLANADFENPTFATADVSVNAVNADNKVDSALTAYANATATYKFQIGKTNINEVASLMNAANVVRECVFEFVITDAGCQPTFDQYNAVPPTLTSLSAVVDTKYTKCLKSTGNLPTAGPLTATTCSQKLSFSSGPTATSNLYKLGNFAFHKAEITDRYNPAANGKCLGTQQLDFENNCYNGYNSAFGMSMKFAATSPVFLKTTVPIPDGATGSTHQLLCSDASNCVLSVGGDWVDNHVSTYKAIDVKKSATVGLAVKSPNVYKNVASNVAVTAPSSTVFADYAFTVTYSENVDTTYLTTLETKLDTLTTNVGTLTTNVSKISVNSSASIVPLFLLGVFGSVFALTM